MADEMVWVFMDRSAGLRNGPLYGPGRVQVPRALADALGLSPQIVETDISGNPLPHTLAAATGGVAPATLDRGSSIPVPARETTGEPGTDDHDSAIADPDADGADTPASRFAAEVADNAESGDERQGGKLLGETEEHLDDSRQLFAQPGQREEHAATTRQRKIDERAAAARAGAAAGATARRAGNAAANAAAGTTAETNAAGDEETGPKPATKTALKEHGDLEALKQLGRQHNVAGADEWTNKEDAVDALYNSRVSLD